VVRADQLVSLMHQESLAKAHNDDQRIAFEEEKRRISIVKGKEHVNSTFTLSTANTPPQTRSTRKGHKKGSRLSSCKLS
ncbi:hypothetical protein Tco_1333834, partial [Tanacetum coccineum]